MILLPVDTAVTVPVNTFPLTDDTDFKSREVAVAYNASGMDLVWNFMTTAGVITQTAVTPTTSGDYDWTHVGDGIYKMELPATGGASANNDTEGYGWFSGIATGVLAWAGPVISFCPVGVIREMIDGTYRTTIQGTFATGTLGVTVNTTSLTGISSDAIIRRVLKVVGTQEQVIITDYLTTNGTITTAPPLLAAPSNGDKFVIL